MNSLIHKPTQSTDIDIKKLGDQNNLTIEEESDVVPELDEIPVWNPRKLNEPQSSDKKYKNYEAFNKVTINKSNNNNKQTANTSQI